MTLPTPDSVTIRKYIPNVMLEVDDETPLAQKLEPYIESAQLWLEREYTGTDDFLSPQHKQLALKIVILRAFADAAPSLDLIITPSGMGVVNTESVAPASKERVDLLIASLNDMVDANISLLVDICRTYPQWRASDRGRFYCQCMMSSPADLRLISGRHGTENLSFAAMLSHCFTFESEMADRYIGNNLLSRLRSDFHSGKLSDSHPLVATIRAADIALLSYRLTVAAPERDLLWADEIIWQYMRRFLCELNYWPEYKEIRTEEMGSLDHPAEFKNDIKGGFYF